jgi:hypothetical protein
MCWADQPDSVSCTSRSVHVTHKGMPYQALPLSFPHSIHTYFTCQAVLQLPGRASSARPEKRQLVEGETDCKTGTTKIHPVSSHPQHTPMEGIKKDLDMQSGVVNPTQQASAVMAEAGYAQSVPSYTYVGAPAPPVYLEGAAATATGLSMYNTIKANLLRLDQGYQFRMLPSWFLEKLNKISCILSFATSVISGDSASVFLIFTYLFMSIYQVIASYLQKRLEVGKISMYRCVASVNHTHRASCMAWAAQIRSLPSDGCHVRVPHQRPRVLQAVR